MDPCHQLAPILEELASEQKERLTIVTMDAEANRAIPARYGVIGLPAMQLSYRGEVVHRIIGVKPKVTI